MKDAYAIMSISADKYQLTAFEEALQQALKLYDAPEKLGESSPLAAPYFLSHLLPKAIDRSPAYTRGITLRTAIRQAAATLWEDPFPRTYQEMKEALLIERQTKGTPRYAYLILEMRYFREFFQPSSLRAIYEREEYLFDSKAGDYRAHRLAIQQLADALIGYLHPVLRPEVPPHPPTLIGYEPHIQQARIALEAGQRVTMSGPSGIGKSTTGAMLVHTWPSRAIFWFTLRPTLNDQLNSLLFALGHFLQTHGSSQLWRFLTASGGMITEWGVAQALAQEDLAALAEEHPLLCFDELDHLYYANPEEMPPHRRQILEFLESLSGCCAQLLMGQRPLLQAEQHIELTGLAVPQMSALFASVDLTLTESSLQRLFDQTQGNPRLLYLCIALMRNGETIEKILSDLDQYPGFAPLFDRLWRQLREEERNLLEQLSVFRTTAPADAWQTLEDCIERLRQLRLLQADGTGGIELLPAIRQQIYANMTQQAQTDCHIAAALIRQDRGEFTPAAYHWVRAERLQVALWTWYPRRHQEIARGQGPAAYDMFTQFSAVSFSREEQKALAELLATLEQLQGRFTPGLERLAPQKLYDESELTVRLQMLRGTFQEALGYPDQALESYADGLSLAMRLLEQAMSIHYQRGLVSVRQRELADAWQACQTGEALIGAFRALLNTEEGNYNDAYLGYQEALAIAQTIGDEPLIIRIYTNLTTLLNGQGRFEESLQYAEKALELCERRGDVVNAESARNSMITTHMWLKNYQKAVELGEASLRILKALNKPYNIAIAAANLAESYFELGELQKAEIYATEVLDREERHAYPYALFTLGRIRQEEHKLSDASAYLRESIRISQLNDDPYMEAYGQRELGKVYLEQCEVGKGTQALERAMHYFKRIDNTEEIQQTAHWLERVGSVK